MDTTAPVTNTSAGMQTATGREVVLTMLDLATDIAHWNKKYTTKTVLLKKLEEIGLTSHQVEVLGFMYANPELDTVSAMASEMFISKGSLSLMISKLENGGFDGFEVRVDKDVTITPGAQLIGTFNNPIIIKRGELV